MLELATSNLTLLSMVITLLTSAVCCSSCICSTDELLVIAKWLDKFNMCMLNLLGLDGLKLQWTYVWPTVEMLSLR